MFWLLIRPVMVNCWECCEDVASDAVRTDGDGDTFCADCYSERYTQCHNCRSEVTRGDALTSDDGDDYCEECYHDTFVRCASCGDETSVDDCRSDDSGDSLCDSCYTDIYTSCEHCGCAVSRDDAITSESRDDYCSSCYHELHYSCEHCGCEVWHGDGRCSGSGNCYCDDCYCELAHDDAFCCDNGTFCSECRDEGEFWESSPLQLRANWKSDNVGSRRAFGVELETSQADDRSHIQENTLFGCVDDCSITGAEFVSPILRGDAGLEAIDDFCAAARSFRVDEKCGFHLHVDCSDLSPSQLWSVAVGYSFTESVWRLFVPASRAANKFCAPWPQKTHDLFRLSDFTGKTHRDVVSSIGWQRYHVCNLTAFDRHKTIEIRLHSATLDAAKISNWVKAHTRFVDFCAARTARGLRSIFRGKSKNQVFRVLAQRAWRDESLAQFYSERAAKFGHELKYVARHVDGQRARRIADPARQSWYASHRSERFAARMATV